MKTVAFIGAGVMGSCMVGRLLDAGYTVHVSELVKEKVDPLVQRGAIYYPTPAEAVQDADIAITMLGYPRDVEQVYFGEKGLLAVAKQGTLLIDMTTSSPSLAIRVNDVGRAKGLFVLDAPVSGGDVGASTGTLSIMVGGDPEVFQMAMPLFSVMGKTITLTGGAGMGQNTKMANQIAVGCNVTAVAEALAYARATGLNPGIMFKCVSGGAGGSWQMTNMSERMVKSDDSAGFFIRHLIKDIDIALVEAEEHNLKLPLLSQVREIYGKLAAAGMENCGTQAVHHYYEIDKIERTE